MSTPSLLFTLYMFFVAFIIFAIGSEIYQVGKIVNKSKPVKKKPTYEYREYWSLEEIDQRFSQISVKNEKMTAFTGLPLVKRFEKYLVQLYRTILLFTRRKPF